jgi:hypothetical protein
MGPQTFVNLLSVVLAFVASLFFCSGSAQMKGAQITALAGTYWGSNPHLRAFLISLKADYLSGALLLCFAFFLQFFANVPGFFPAGPELFSVHVGAFLAAIIGGAVGGGFYLYRRGIAKSLNQRFTQPPAQ